MEPNDVLAIAGIIVGALTTIAAAWVPPGPWRKRVIVVGLTALVLGGSGYLALRSRGTRIEIADPSSASRVDPIEIVSGTSRSIPAGNEIVVVVYSHADGHYYPNDQAALIDATGAWESPNTIVGAREDGGQLFDIIAALVNVDGRRALAVYYPIPERAGLETLPDGVTVFDRVEVLRR